ncbi:helicase-like protein [Saccharothrix carnea]|uniref:Helicase-like protein n=1 Tax=Saccharothrix carnea TaxID=1280637 RepID=A0A2P8IDL4_SACCR|nr:DISARM system helicase DrmA [Saccharothrix carnea]PSL56568.1 helicase-like protein [Saccharothrix carnea]
MNRPSVLPPPEPRVIRDRLQELVLKDLLGPLEGEHEEFTREDPLDRYPLGRLAPRGEVIEPETQDELAESAAAEPEEGVREPSAPNTASLALSSIGFTTTVAGDVDRLEVTAKWGRYERVTAETAEGLPNRVWRRVPLKGTVTVALAEGQLVPMAVVAEAPDVVVRGKARRHGSDWLVSLFLENRQPRGNGRASADWLFQAELSAAAPGGAEVFLPRPDEPSGGHPVDQDEQRGLAMTYRFVPEFAIGHGAAVTAERRTDRSERAVRLTTSTVPHAEVPATDVPNVEDDEDLEALRDVVLDMRVLAELADGPPEPLAAVLRPLVTGYRTWIEQRTEEVDGPDARLDGHRSEAVEALKTARRTADRIEAGVALLETDVDVRRAFGFANRAMAEQRVHSEAADVRRRDRTRSLAEVVAEVDVPTERSWRPFQLAFVLLNLPSLADPRHDERSPDRNKGLADLLWFPTGGGKTEAYLGLTAFTLAIRRLQPAYGGLRADEGVAVLMRYTLRLLTIQQFERATTLICAAEVLRRDDLATWGPAPFRVGLWVGGRVTPNRTDDAADWVQNVRRSRGKPTFGQGSPHQVTNCPWCGTPIDKGGIDVEKASRRTVIECADVLCPFGALPGPSDPWDRGLPVLVVDEEIYRHPPSLLIATVDKFAQLPWKGETAALFGRVGKRCDVHGYLAKDAEDADWEKKRHAGRRTEVTWLRPPDLIIQDELHLISGPLGSLVGLYETAVDLLATWRLDDGRSVRPKVVASTATVRRATQQIGDLFNRRTEVFPPSGLTVDDSYFARRRPVRDRPGRRYVGICAHGSRMKSTLIRVYVSVLGAAQRLHEEYGRNEVTDPYMTLVGYFNSLRDLGGMRRLVEDDVSARLVRADQRGLAKRYDLAQAELTSRMNSDAIRPLLDKLEIRFGDRPKGSPKPIDVLLATSMIAVGVDVPRLGVMVVTNQPKSTAEYIQATSRVGRQAPGLVFTVYNWARPRDLSHFETFEHFHQTYYRRVEALSVTPFADRAIDRGLTGVMVALVRNLELDHNGNFGARTFDRHSKLADHVVRRLGQRAEAFPRGAKQRVTEQLEQRLDQWAKAQGQPGVRLGYDQPPASGDIAGLLRRAGTPGRSGLPAPTSLRDVEPGIQLQLLPGIDPWGDEPRFRPPNDDTDGGDR